MFADANSRRIGIVAGLSGCQSGHFWSKGALLLDSCQPENRGFQLPAAS